MNDVSVPPNSLAATPQTFFDWGLAGQDLLDGLAKTTNTPHLQRVLREFRRSEAMEIGGISEHRWHKSRQGSENTETRVTLEDIHRMQEESGIRPRRPEGSKAIRLAIANFKGGASKTTVSLHLAHYLAFHGWRCLVIDSDPQGTLSRLFGFLPEQIDSKITLSAIFFDDEPGGAGLAPIPTHIHGLDIVPASLDMIGADIRVAAAFQRQDNQARDFFRLADRAISKIEDRYDVILIDTAPAFSFAALNILWAANAILCPVPPSMPDLSATIDFDRMVGEVIGQLEGLTGESKVWNPAVVVHTRVGKSNDAEGIRRLASKVWKVHRTDESLPESSAFQSALSRLRSVYEVTSADIDSRSLRRAREAADLFGARMVEHFNQAWAEKLTRSAT